MQGSVHNHISKPLTGIQTENFCIVQPLSIIFEKLWQSGKVPSDWRKGNAAPIFKKGNKEDSGYYRPVSLTSMPDHGTDPPRRYTETYGRQGGSSLSYKDSQHGFTKGKSCLTNLVAFYNGGTASVDTGRAMDATYLDLCKALDTVPHNVLATKLERDGFDGWTI
ncbi:LOW QUALITY PROTEIN: hypothetical protein QYF61_022276 [Mycteria americana]|uniref:Uncharacterized protein n=1 Tax=Mycteria americana TaxID=33587 RepID=A0AAN7S472_MYCAM|nr:LOW QUALITY PROTEIN: hypothetical protein QYF61_022276 [Mycteria americana]